jgi:ribosome-binding protein aMBF1 (putative translation factor)
MATNNVHLFVYQEWDVMRERPALPEEKLEKLPPVSLRHMTFAMRLQEARIKNRLTIQELAGKCNLEVYTITLFENGTEVPSPDIANKINKVLNIE